MTRLVDGTDARAAELAKANRQEWQELTESQRDDYRRLIRDAGEVGRKASRLAFDEIAPEDECDCPPNPSGDHTDECLAAREAKAAFDEGERRA